MFGFFKPKTTGLPSNIVFYTEKIAELERRLHRRVPIDEHAVDHLCDFVSTVANIHPLGPTSQAATDLRIIAQAVRTQAGRRCDPSDANAIREVFSRYEDYRDKEVTYEHLFELAEWILEGALRMGDGCYEPKALNS